MNKRRILIINQPVNNRGDEAAHKAFVRTLSNSFPNDIIEVLIIGEPFDSVQQFKVSNNNIKYTTVLCYRLTDNWLYNKIIRSLCLARLFEYWIKFCLLHDNYNLLKFSPWFHYIQKKIRKSDLIINAPGGICMGGFQNWKHISYLLVAQKYKKDIYYYGRSFGPFPVKTQENIKFKEISINLLHSFKFLSIRDSKTELLAKELGVNYITTVDTAYLENPYVELPNEINKRIKSNYMVFVPNLLQWHFAYKNIPLERIIYMYISMMDIIHKVYPNLQIVMLPQTFNYKNALTDDIHFFKLLKSKYRLANLIEIINDSYSSDIQQVIISNAKFLVGARYHSAVFAINNKVPFIALSYEHKIFGMLQTLGGEENMINIQDLSTDSIIKEILLEFTKRISNMNFDEIINQRAKEITNHCYDMLIKQIQ